ncbi:hypothetical protein DSO57_1028446 [Entomophthora muscae]|uniref:Uncharacterized protein n=1 Tax=Entomophthora muscae TaxID=34485 RepID=A0ACC2SED4_9FUNG|nr:hypothetical protein DSO57_1028446 [Entomophthora muscae]
MISCGFDVNRNLLHPHHNDPVNPITFGSGVVPPRARPLFLGKSIIIPYQVNKKLPTLAIPKASNRPRPRMASHPTTVKKPTL